MDSSGSCVLGTDFSDRFAVAADGGGGEDRFGTGPLQERTEVICVDLRYWVGRAKVTSGDRGGRGLVPGARRFLRGRAGRLFGHDGFHIRL